MEPNQKFNAVLNIELEDFTFDKPQEEFESAINLELHIVMKEMREYIMDEYAKRKAVKVDP